MSGYGGSTSSHMTVLLGSGDTGTSDRSIPVYGDRVAEPL